MLAQLTLTPSLPKTLSATHLLVLLPKAKMLPKDAPHGELLAAVLKRRDMKADELGKSPVAANAANGTLVAWVMVDLEKDTFAQQVQVRKALQPLLEEQPKVIAVSVSGDAAQRQRMAELAVYGAWVNGALLPVHKKKDERKSLQKIELYGFNDKKVFDALKAQAAGNLLCRELTVLPPNELTPGNYRQRVKKLATANGWKHEELTMPKLRKMGAGAFVAVAQGSDPEDAAIVHLSYKHPKAKQTIALVGKGICFDTGGHNLKPSRYMHNMHEDMNGSAVSLGILLAATQQKLAVNIDCWLALAQNHISPKAYKQNDIVKALNGTFIEVMHTDAEGRMVLADTLTLASRAKPNLIIDFATLTGSMAMALGARYSGVFGTSDELAQRAVSIGKQTGERLCAFPQDEDYEAALDSKVADIKQCTLDGDADHILATRFLKRFVEHDTPWVHVDLSASRCEGGLGIVAHDVNGFGVAWGLRMLQE
ncbi:M17 family metallopeptidase [Sideroxydans lithotrophicus]|uniref:Leucyl aminopeptidase n=1 Tax=Sideroxydans lithotrophicus (strain ES-1) TaxID=580332 RepID=D5CN47_SIDLE|nr:leucyl aminopeptidase family protein [Sideroxydans lithotrophicus]ADE12744.1 Leucyl aminopeptidase [Sideroxydans lithotrophicus ES-1]